VAAWSKAWGARGSNPAGGMDIILQHQCIRFRPQYHIIINVYNKRTAVTLRNYVTVGSRFMTGLRSRVYGCTRVGTLIVATIYLQLIQNRYMFRSFTVLQCSHRHCVQPVASDVEVVGYL